MKTNKKSLRQVLALFALGALTACGEYNYTEPLSEEEKADRPYVYGDVDGPARQSKNTYEAPPDLAAQAAELKTKLYGDFEHWDGYTVEDAVADERAPGGGAVPDSAQTM